MRSPWRDPLSENSYDFQRTTLCSSCCLACSMAAHCVAIGSEWSIPYFRPKSRLAELEMQEVQPTMRRLFFGLLFFSMTICRGAFGGEVPAPGSDLAGSLKTPARAAGDLHPSRSSKRASRVKPDAGSGPRSLPLSSAAAYGFEHPTTLPMSPAQPAPSASRTWTGFYVGAGAGAARP
jgi:hypothetical protein